MFGQLLANHFTALQLALGLAIIGIFFFRKLKEDSESQFRVREADRKLNFERGENAKTVAGDRVKKPALLTGARVDGASHEILGVSALATEDEIQKAYKSLMKRYHPDKMGPPGSREWQDTQVIAEALNRARADMLERVKRRAR